MSQNSAKELEIHFEIDKPCLLNCIHCSSRHSDEDPQIKIYSLIKMIEHLKKNKINLIITGGEPLLSKKIDLLLKEIKGYSQIKSTGLFSSGYVGNHDFISKTMANNLSNLGVNFFYISLYSHNMATHDSITQVKGSFYNTVKSIQNLVKAGIKVNIHFVPMKINLCDLDKMMLFFSELEVSEVRFLRLVKHGRAVGNWNYIGLSYEDQKKVVEDLILYIEQFKIDMRLTIAGFPEFWNCRPFNTGIKCQAGISLFYIDKYGDVYPCACKKNDKKSLLFNIECLKDVNLIAKREYNTSCQQK